MDHLVYTPKSSTYLKYGKAHFRMFISGSISLAIASRTIIFVSNVANYPSNFILFSLIIVSMSTKRCMPFRSSKAWVFNTLKQFCNWP